MLVRDVIQATASAGGMSVSALLAPNLARDVARLRQIGMLISSRLTARSWPALGQDWGGRDHTTALHGAKRIAQLLDEADPLVLSRLARILELLGVDELPADRPENAQRLNRRPDRRLASIRRASQLRAIEIQAGAAR